MRHVAVLQVLLPTWASASIQDRVIALHPAATVTLVEHEAEFAAMEGICAGICNNDMGSKCYAKCYSEMSPCLDGGSGTQTPLEKSRCTRLREVVVHYEKLAADGKAETDDSFMIRETVKDVCEEACGPAWHDVNSQCVTECQAEMYKCLDHDRRVNSDERVDWCKEQVAPKYKNAKQYHLVAQHHEDNVAYQNQQIAYILCKTACSKSTSGSCGPQCESEMHSCFANGAELYEKCEKGVVEQYEGLVAEQSKGHFLSKKAPQEADIKLERVEMSKHEHEEKPLVVEHEKHVRMSSHESHEGVKHDEVKVQQQVHVKLTRVVAEKAHKNEHKAVVVKKASKSGQERKHVQDVCLELCTVDGMAESRCVTGCESEMFQCVDNNVTRTEEKPLYDACEAKVLAKYKAQAQAVHFSARKERSSVEKKHVQDVCLELCTEDGMAESRCVTGCESELFQCVDNDVLRTEEKPLYDACEAKVVAKYRKVQAVLFAAHKAHVMAKKRHAHDVCIELCTVDGMAESRCVTGCESELFQCVDNNVTRTEEKPLYDACEAKVLAKYKAQSQSVFFAARSTREVSAEQQKHVQDVCLELCTVDGMAESRCVTGCESEMFQCVDNNVTRTEEKPLFDACEAKVQAKYKAQAQAVEFKVQRNREVTDRHVQDVCLELCTVDGVAESRCVTGCESELFQCVDNNVTRTEEKPLYEACEAKVLAKYKAQAQAVLLSAQKAREDTDRHVQDVCLDLCTVDGVAESRCVTGCESEMFQCVDMNVTRAEEKPLYDACEAKVQAKYKAQVQSVRFAVEKVHEILEQQHKHAHDVCLELCTVDGVAESRCVTGCESELFQCVDNNVTRTEEKPLYDACEAKVLAKYKAQIQAVQFAILNEKRAAKTKHAHDVCVELCTVDGMAESRCVTGCESEMFQCVDNNVTRTEEKPLYDACEAKVLAKYKAQVQAVQFAIRREKVATQKKHAHDVCLELCTVDGMAESRCVTGCESEMFQCVDNNVTRTEEKPLYEACEAKVLAKYKAQVQAVQFAVQQKKAAVQKKHARDVCLELCTVDGMAESRCVTGCESELFQCVDNNVTRTEEKPLYDACEAKVLAKYKAQAQVVQFNIRKEKRHAHDICLELCSVDGMAESRCVTGCESEMFQCVDNNVTRTEEKPVYDTCVSNVEAKYKAQAQAVQFAAHKAQADAIAQRQRAQEKCVKVCTLADVLQVNCTSGCEFEMSGCIGRDASACETTFTTKYRMVAGVSQAATERQIKEEHARQEKLSKDLCKSLCNEHSMCITECEADVQMCVEEKVTAEKKPAYKACMDSAKAKYYQEAEPEPVHLVVSNATMSEEDRKNIHESCLHTCESDGDHHDGIDSADSKCVTACEAEMYRCHNYNQHIEEQYEAFQKCEERVHHKFAEESAKFHLLARKGSGKAVEVASHNVSAKVRADIEGICHDICDSSSSCVTGCETEMFQCVDFNQTREDEKAQYKECEDRVAAKYQDVAANEVHLVAVKNISSFGGELTLTNEEKKENHKTCMSACEVDGDLSDSIDSADSKCVTSCEADMYRCHNYNQHIKEQRTAFEECKARVEATHAVVATHFLVKRRKEREAKTQCGDWCAGRAGGSDSHCVTDCEAEMYQCNDHNKTRDDEKAAHDECVGKVQAKFSSAGTQHTDTTDAHFLAQEHKVDHDFCVVVCDDPNSYDGPEGQCVTGCESDMYRCHNYNSTVPEGKVAFEQCKAGVKAKYTAAASSAHFIARAANMTDALRREITDSCNSACGQGVDSSCATDCETELYHCHEQKQTASGTGDAEGEKKFETCKTEVLDKYKSFKKDWNSTRGNDPSRTTHLVASVNTNATEDLLRSFASACADVCGAAADSSCVPNCQTKIYHCHEQKITAPASPTGTDEEGEEEFQKCKQGVLDSYKSSANFVAQRKAKDAAHTNTVAEDSAVQELCNDACGPGVGASCSSECSTDMLTCQAGEIGADAYDTCTRAVLDKYESYEEKQEATHLLGGKKAEVTEEDRQAIDGLCQNACGDGAPASCAGECHKEMYSCLDKSGTAGTTSGSYEECEASVVEKFADVAPATPLASTSAVETPVMASQAVGDAASVKSLCSSMCDSDEKCNSGCKTTVDECMSKVVSETQLDHYSACEKEAVAKYDALAANFMAGEDDASKIDCGAVCDQASGTECMPGCQSELHQCPQGATEYEDCRRHVLDKYESFADASQHSTRPAKTVDLGARKGSLKVARIASSTDTKQLAELVDLCTSVCAKVDSKCGPQCETEMKHCASGDQSKFGECKQDVVDTYGTYASLNAQ